MIVYSHFEKASFDKSISNWFPFVTDARPNKPTAFVSTKLDLLSSKLSETLDQVASANTERRTSRAKIEGLKSSYFECSSLTKEGIKETMESLIFKVGKSLHRLLLTRV